MTVLNCIICDDDDYHNDTDNYEDGVFVPRHTLKG